MKLREHGNSLVELLIVIGLLSGTVAASMAALTSTTARDAISQQNETYLLKRISFVHSLQQLLNLSDQHRLPISPRLHAQGTLTFTNGEKHPLAMRMDRLGIHADGTALSALELNLLHSYTIVECVKHSPHLATVKACERYTTIQPLPDSPQFLAIGIDQVLEVSSTSTAHHGCFTTTLENIKSLTITAGDPVQWCLLRVLIPIKATRTLYLDKAGTWRLVQTAAEKIIENQPLIDEIQLVTLALLTEGPSYPYHLKGALTIGGKKPFDFHIQNLLGRTSWLTFLLDEV